MRRCIMVMIKRGKLGITRRENLILHFLYLLSIFISFIFQCNIPMSTDSDDSLPSEPTFRTLINVTVTTDAIDQRSRHTSEDQICQAIGIAAHSRLGCKDDASPRRHRFKFISLNLSFYIIFSKIPIKTSVKYLAIPLVYLPSFTFHFNLNHQFPSFSLISFLYQINHNHHTSSRKFIFRIELHKPPTDRHSRSPSLSLPDT